MGKKVKQIVNFRTTPETNGQEITFRVSSALQNPVVDFANRFFDPATLQIWTGSGQTGTQLSPATDYTIGPPNASVTETIGKAICTSISIINSQLFNIDLFVPVNSLEGYGDVLDASDVNRLQAQIDEGASSGDSFGVFSPTATYPLHALVIWTDSKQYISLQDNNLGNAPGTSPTWWKLFSSASATTTKRTVGDVYPSLRSAPIDGELPLNGQVVSIVDYPDLFDAVYVGDAENNTADFCYRCSDLDGDVRDVSGNYFKLPDARGLTAYGVGNNDDVTTAKGDGYHGEQGYRLDQFQGHAHAFLQTFKGPFEGDTTLGTHSFSGLEPSFDDSYQVKSPTDTVAHGTVRAGDTTQSAGFGVYWYVKATETDSGGGGVGPGAEPVILITKENQEYELPSNPEVGDSVKVIVTKDGRNSFITQPEKTVIVGDDFQTDPGTSGRLPLKPYQALELVSIGDISDYKKETYELDAQQVTIPGPAYPSASSPNGQFIAVSHQDAPRLSLFKKGATGFEPLPVNVPVVIDILALAWSHDSRYLAIALANAPYLMALDLDDANNITEVTLPNRPTSGAQHTDYALAWSPTDHYLVEGHARDPFITIYEIRDTGAIVEITSGITGLSIVHTIAFSPDGKKLAIGHTGRSSKLELYEWNNGSPVKIPFTALDRGSDIRTIAWAADNLSMAIINAGTFQLIDWSTGAPVLSQTANILLHPGFTLSTLDWLSRDNIMAVGVYNSADNTSHIDFYAYENARLTEIQELEITGIAGQVFGAYWVQPGEHYFIVGHSGAPYLSIYVAGTVQEGAWQLVTIDEPEDLGEARPIGSTHIQFPGEPNPNNLGMPGDWSNISNELGGDFIRFEGSNGDSGTPLIPPNASNAFNGARQVDRFQGHEFHVFGGEHGSATPISAIPDHAPGYFRGGSSSVYDYQIDASLNNPDGTFNTAKYGKTRKGVTSDSYGNGTPRYGAETRPANRTVRLWKRIS